MYIYIYTYIYICICIFVYICIYTYIYIYVSEATGALLAPRHSVPAECRTPAVAQVGTLARSGPKARSAVEDFMATLDEPKAQWGLFHMIVAQTALQRPIYLAQPVDGVPGWHIEPVCDMVAAWLCDMDVEVPATPHGEPLRLLPTRLHQVRVSLESLSHWDPLVPVPIDQMKMAVEAYAEHHYRMALARAQSAPSWQRMLATDASTYGGDRQKQAFLAEEYATMERQSQAWGNQAAELRQALGCVPIRVIADGSCASASLSIAMGGKASLSDKDALRNRVRDEAERMLKEVEMQKLLFLIDGKPCSAASKDSVGMPSATQVEDDPQGRGGIGSPPPSLREPHAFQGGVSGECDRAFAARMRACVTMKDARSVLETSLQNYRKKAITREELLNLVDLGRDKVAAHVQETQVQSAVDTSHQIADTVDAQELKYANGLQAASGVGAEDLHRVDTTHSGDAGRGATAEAECADVASNAGSLTESLPPILRQEFRPRICTGIPTPRILISALRWESRSYTVRGSQMALALLRGVKPCENRDAPMRPGWYVLHAGDGSIASDQEAILNGTWPTAPDAKSLPRKALFGMVLHGPPVEPSAAFGPWALGRLCHPVLATVEFSTPILNVSGKHNVWYLDSAAQGSVAQALASSEYRDFDAPSLETQASQQLSPSLDGVDQSQPPHSELSVLENNHFGFKYKRARTPGDVNAADAVESDLNRMKATRRHEAFLQNIWPADLFRNCANEKELYDYVQHSLDAIHKDERHHHDIAQDGTFSSGLVVPRPLGTAATQISMKHGVHCETLLLALASNITWQEHNWTRLGADPPPPGVNVVEEYVGATAYAAGLRADFAPLSERKSGFDSEWSDHQSGGSQMTVNGPTARRRTGRPPKRVRVGGGNAGHEPGQSEGPAPMMPACLPGLECAVSAALEGQPPERVTLAELKRRVAQTLRVAPEVPGGRC